MIKLRKYKFMAASQARKSKILLVEDERVISKAYKIGFESAGFEVTQCFDGEEGLEKAKSVRPDIILLDLIMPKMNGITFLKSLRGQDWGKNIPVLILTNSNDSKRHAEAEQLGISDFLLKAEWSLELLVKKVKAILKIK